MTGMGPWGRQISMGKSCLTGMLELHEGASKLFKHSSNESDVMYLHFQKAFTKASYQRC